MLHFIAAGVASSTGEPFFQRLTEYLGKALGVDYALVSTLDRDGHALTTLSVYARGAHIDNFSYALAGTPCERAVQGAGEVFTRASGVQRDFPRNHLLTRMGVDAYSGAALLASDGRPLGLLVVLHRMALANAALAELLLRIFAARAAAELERRANDQQLARLNRWLRTTSAVHQMMLHADDRDILLRDTCRILVEHGGLRMAWVGLADFASGTVTPVAHAGAGFDYIEALGIRCDDTPQGQGPTGTAIRRGEPVVNPDSETNPVFAPWRQAARALGYRSSAAFPLRAHGRVIGAVSAYAAEPHAFEAEETALLAELVATIGQRLTALDDVAAHALTEAAMRQRESDFRLLFEHNPLPMFIYDRDTYRFLAVNDAALRQYGYTREEFRGLTIFDICPPEEVARLKRAIAATPSGLYVAAHWRHRRNGGEVFDAEVTAHRIDFEGRSAEFVMAVDVSERLRASEERRQTLERLRQSEERLRTAFEANPATTIILRLADRVVLYVNRAWEEATGWAREAVLGRPISDLGLWADAQTRAELIERARREGSVRNAEWQRRTRGGELRDVQGSIERIEIEGSECVVIFTQDITERKRAEEALRNSEVRFRQVFETTPVILSITRERDFAFVDLNDAFCEATGWTRAEAIGRTDLELGLWPDPGERQAMVERLLAQGAIHDAEWRLRTRSGEIRNILGSAERMRLGDESCILVVGQDITERRRASEAMRKLSSAVEQTADSVMITNRDGVIEYVNPAFALTTGFAPAEAIGRTPHIVKSGRHDEAFYRELWQTILAGGVYRNVMVNRRKDGSLYYEEKTITPLKNERGAITHFVSTGKDITERMQVQERLQYLAHHDDLTRLPNRVLFLDRLSQALIRAHFHHRILAVLFLDLDHFKNINDSLGHNVGDQFLEATAVRLTSCVREGDTVARLGGDEFAVLLEDIAQVEDISMVARKVLAAFASPFTVGSRELYLTTSIGVSLYPSDGADGHTLLKHADAAMYRAKELGRNNFQFYSADMSARAFERLTLETHLRHALERREFVLYYQPQVDVTRGRITAVEALIRWQHPEFGLLGPQQFIGLAEDTGLIVPIGEWVTRAACGQARAWREAGFGTIGVAVNLSARQFNEPDFVDRMVRLVADSRVEAGALEFELTEGTVMKNAQQTVDRLLALNNLGVRFAIDDFGTGYSSLSYLSRFPIHTLKIDRSFVQNAPRDANDAEIVKTIIAMARSLKLAVIAEGVEDAEQLALLRSQGCEVMQGYHLCRPVPAEEMTRLLQSGRRLP